MTDLRLSVESSVIWQRYLFRLRLPRRRLHSYDTALRS